MRMNRQVTTPWPSYWQGWTFSTKWVNCSKQCCRVGSTSPPKNIYLLENFPPGKDTANLFTPSYSRWKFPASYSRLFQISRPFQICCTCRTACTQNTVVMWPWSSSWACSSSRAWHPIALDLVEAQANFTFRIGVRECTVCSERIKKELAPGRNLEPGGMLEPGRMLESGGNKMRECEAWRE